MKQILRRATFLTLLPVTALAQGLNTDNATVDYPIRLKLAKEYIALNPTKKALANSVGSLAESSTMKVAFDAVDYQLLDLQAAELMAELFTSSEIKALVDFQKSPVGERIVVKMPTYQQIMGSKVQEALRKSYEANLTPFGIMNRAATPASPNAAAPASSELGQGTPIQIPTGTPPKK